LGFVQRVSPFWLRRDFDFLVRGMVVEADVRFAIRTLFDFRIFSFSWEPELAELFELEEGMVFLDVGAHIGKYAVRAAVKVGDSGRVVAVEPDRDNFQLLVKNIALNGLRNCIPLRIAAYSSEGEITLFKGPSSAEHSTSEDFGKGSYKVRARVLDNVLTEIGVAGLDLIKIDVEGAEIDVLRGLEGTLRKGKARLIMEVMKRDDAGVVGYLNGLDYRERLISFYPSYRGGLSHYCFEKE
jgi:FkbM family methyltransferase